jgi:hypothetical protein
LNHNIIKNEINDFYQEEKEETPIEKFFKKEVTVVKKNENIKENKVIENYQEEIEKLVKNINDSKTESKEGNRRDNYAKYYQLNIFSNERNRFTERSSLVENKYEPYLMKGSDVVIKGTNLENGKDKIKKSKINKIKNLNSGFLNYKLNLLNIIDNDKYLNWFYFNGF